jgi:WD40 repeat protein
MVGAGAVLVATGGADCKVHFWHADLRYAAPAAAATAPAAVLRPVLAVSGHEDWIRAVAFSRHASLEAHFPASTAAASASAVADAEAQQQAADTGTVYLASASQDRRVRLWKIELKELLSSSNSGDVSSSVASAGQDDDADDDDEEGEGGGEGGKTLLREERVRITDSEHALLQLEASSGGLHTLQNPKYFVVPDLVLGSAAASGASVAASARYEVTFDALLGSGGSGHEAWVNSVAWHPPVAVLLPASAANEDRAWRLIQPPCVLTASHDKTCIFWAATGKIRSCAASDSTAKAYFDPWGGVWEPAARMGGSGGTSAGLYGACIAPDASRLYAHGYLGASHVWVNNALLVEGNALAKTGQLSSAVTHYPMKFLPLVNRPDSFDVRGLSADSIRSGETQEAEGQTETPLELASDALRCMSGATAGDSAPALGVWSSASRWLPAPTVLGHFGAVEDAVWGGDGRYLLTVGEDASTRVWAPVAFQGGETRWLEVARPQIHGYGMTAAAMPAIDGVPHRLVSAGDEKVVRVFDAPRLFVRALDTVCKPAFEQCGYTAAMDSGSSAEAADLCRRSNDLLASVRAEFAYVPELGLTNKPVAAESTAPIRDQLQLDGRDASQGATDARLSEMKAAVGASIAAGAEGANAEDAAGVETSTPQGAPVAAVSATATHESVSSCMPAVCPGLLTPAAGGGPCAPPLEEDTVANTRWPEVDKLFGHPHEITALAVDPRGIFIASASKAREEKAARIRLWDAVTCRPHQTLPLAHKLSVVTLAFSSEPSALECISGTDAAGVFTVPVGSCSAASTDGVWQPIFLISAGKDRQIAVFGEVDHAAAPADAVGDSDGVGGGGAFASLPPEVRETLMASRDSFDGATLPRFGLLALVKGAHKRIIWGVSWAPLPAATNLRAFASGARDQVVKVWTVQQAGLVSTAAAIAVPAPASAASSAVPARPKRTAGDEDEGDNDNADADDSASFPLACAASTGASSSAASFSLAQAVSLPIFNAAVTSVSFAPVAFASATEASMLLAVGLETGAASFWRIASSRSSVQNRWETWTTTQVGVVHPLASHRATVTRLAWRPLPSAQVQRKAVYDAAQGTAALEIASTSKDETIRFFKVTLKLA